MRTHLPDGSLDQSWDCDGSKADAVSSTWYVRSEHHIERGRDLRPLRDNNVETLN